MLMRSTTGKSQLSQQEIKHSESTNLVSVRVRLSDTIYEADTATLLLGQDCFGTTGAPNRVLIEVRCPAEHPQIHDVEIRLSVEQSRSLGRALLERESGELLTANKLDG